MKKMVGKIAAFPLRLLLSPYTTVACLIVLCILVLWGTLFQIDNGIYAAKQRFFNAWIVLIAGVLPFPGVRLTVLILILSQTAVLIFRQAWKWNKAGLILTHVGILILLIGGGIVSYTSHETYLSLWEGESAAESASYTKWEIAIWPKPGAKPDPQSIETFACDTLRKGQTLGLRRLHADILIEQLFINCSAFLPRMRSDTGMAGPAVVDSLAGERPSVEPEKNVFGAIVTIAGSGQPQGTARRLFLYGADPEPAFAASGADTLCVSLRQKRTPLPLSVTLIDFIKEDYAGTQTARHFSSTIHAKGHDIDREVVVSMNRPFRYRQFTFYQSSYSQNGQRESSTFAVVENRGKSLPYIAGIFMTAGLLLHFCVKLVAFIRRRRTEAA